MNPFRSLFPPSAQFNVGDLCWLKLPDDEPAKYRPLSGRECTVVGSLQLVRYTDGEVRWAHHIEIAGENGIFYAVPEVLIKQPPPETKLENWHECPFQPKKVAA